MTPITFTHLAVRSMSLYNDTTRSRPPTCRSRMCSRPTVVSVLAVGRAVGRVAVLAVLLAVCGPVLVWLSTVCHACLLGRPGEGTGHLMERGNKQSKSSRLKETSGWTPHGGAHRISHQRARGATLSACRLSLCLSIHVLRLEGETERISLPILF